MAATYAWRNKFPYSGVWPMALVSRSEFARIVGWCSLTYLVTASSGVLAFELLLPKKCASSLLCLLASIIAAFWIPGALILYLCSLVRTIESRLKAAGFRIEIAFLILLLVAGDFIFAMSLPVLPTWLLFASSKFSSTPIAYVPLKLISAICWLTFLSVYAGRPKTDKAQDSVSQKLIWILVATTLAIGATVLGPGRGAQIVYLLVMLMVLVMAALIWREHSGGTDAPATAAPQSPPSSPPTAKPSGFGRRSW